MTLAPRPATGGLVALLIVAFLASGVPGAVAGDPTALPVVEVPTAVETPVLFDDDRGGNSSGDDPAIWVHPVDASLSLVVVTAKEGGLRVYDLGGGELQRIAAPDPPAAGSNPGRFNNVDIAWAVPLAGRTVDLAVVSDRGLDQIRAYAIDPAGSSAADPLTDVTAPGQPLVFSADQAEVDEVNTAYGLAVWQPLSGGTNAVVTQAGETSLATVALRDVGGRVAYDVTGRLDLPATFTLPDGSSWAPCDEPGVLSQAEGVVVDQLNRRLYAAQEDVGIWSLRLPLTPASRPRLIDTVREFGVTAAYDEESEECEVIDDPGYGGDLLTADVEGLDIYYAGPLGGYLIASSQGDSTFVVYSRQGRNAPLGRFRVFGTGGVDDVDGSDGLAVTNRAVGPDYPQGMLVTHDEPDDRGRPSRDPTNFSYVSWPDVALPLGLRIDLTPGNDPRLR